MKHSIKTTILLILVALIGFNSFAQRPKRVVSLAPSLTKMVYEMGAQDLLVGCTNYCATDPKDSIKIVASAVEVGLERVLLTKPDLIIASSLTNPSIINSFKKLNIEVITLATPKSFKETCDHMLLLAERMGKTEQAKLTVAKQKERLDKLQASLKSEKLSYFMEIGDKPLFTVTPNTFMHEYITMLGGTNIADGMTHGSITRETVLVKNPDVIVVVLMGVLGEEEKKSWIKYPQLSAVKKNRLFIIDSNKACSPTPTNFVDTMEELATLIFPNK
ncbi:MAG: ABC transporter substrate-binding protein [Breznakibacter sp.]|nr:ABC transporter substrate-binding protein [Breznakibacter sp.]